MQEWGYESVKEELIQLFLSRDLEAVSPLGVRLCWSRTMTGDEIDWTSDAIHFVAREAGQWRVVCLFSDAARDEVRRLLSGT